MTFGSYIPPLSQDHSCMSYKMAGTFRMYEIRCTHPLDISPKFANHCIGCYSRPKLDNQLDLHGTTYRLMFSHLTARS